MFKKRFEPVKRRHGRAHLMVCSVTRLGDLLDFGNFSKLVATISLPDSTTFLDNFCKGVKIFNFSGEINFGQLL